jgi:uncharacterized protein YmfQ (DUF2313 family)
MTFDLTPLNADQQTVLAGKYLPSGKAWNAKKYPDSVMYGVIKGLVTEFERLEAVVKLISDEMDILKTTELLPNWEESVGIPDECFSSAFSLEQRRNNVVTKLSRIPGSITEEDFLAVAEALGFEVTITPGAQIPIGELPGGTTADQQRYYMKVTILNAGELQGFPYTFPITFEESVQNMIQCVFNQMAPANVRVIYDFVV